MNKILIVGHPACGHEQVESLLQACGMAAARPSRQQELSPREVGAMLRRAHPSPAGLQLGYEHGIRQIQTAPLWSGLAMDLMLGNIEQPLWGWSDPDAVHLLDYWRDMDPMLHFILVYEQPHSVLRTEAASLLSVPDRQALQQRIREWQAYNASLLAFFQRNPERCLLINGEQARSSAEAYLHKVRMRIQAPWIPTVAFDGAQEADTRNDATALSIPEAALDSEGAQASLDVPTHPVPDNERALIDYMADRLLSFQPQALQLFDELQNMADLPRDVALKDDDEAEQAFSAWLDMAAQQDRLRHQQRLCDRLDAARDRAEALTQTQQALVEQLKQEQAEQARQQQTQAQTAQQDKAGVEAQLEASRQREQTMARQLAAVQKEQGTLEETRQSLQAEITRLQHDLERQHQDTEREALHARQQQDTLKKQIAERQAQVRHWQEQCETDRQSTRAIQQDHEALIEQLHQVQAELERLLLEAVPTAGTPPRASQPSGAADLVRQEAPYLIGQMLLAHSRKPGGWLSMPAAISRAVRLHGQGAHPSPDLHAYADAHEGERVRRHLSYRIGTTVLTHARSPAGWLKLPLRIRQEVRLFRAERPAT